MPELLVLREPELKDCREILALYHAENWWQGPDNLELVARIIAGSHLFLTVREQGNIIGMGRAISDGVCDAYIQDVTIHGDYRSKGLGRNMVNELCRLLSQQGIEWIGLIAERGSHPFYEKLGFGIMPRALPMLHGKTLQLMGLQ
ncbi:GNAT family N-acetyltransferase [Desulfobotulus sp. H1]|uniref:GNAT family N-acetyltransferase n=1 Tax=Desulfobotulus pelophilus TaxID=2823377 RepID=A0ABT3NAL3_9BACT|nr:GNAT family N-acetyltransferase [Desulfobotulus pelophilus]MCW7754513.1 GNAT family N-acetyltransferase [Desulfobotulus pelophilus]